MKKLLIIGLMALSNMMVLNAAMAFDADEIYFTGGLVDIDDAGETGLQVGAGLPLTFEFEEFTTAAEVEYWSCDNCDALTISGVATREIADQFNLIGRVGYVMILEDGADDEIGFGGGGEFAINDNFSARGELLFAGDADAIKFSVKYTR